MKVVKCKAIDDIPKYPLMRMSNGTQEEAEKDFRRIFKRKPRLAYLLNGNYFCVIEARKEAKDE